MPASRGREHRKNFRPLDVAQGRIFVNESLGLVRAIYMDDEPEIEHPAASDVVRYASFDLRDGSFQGAASCSRRRIHQWADRMVETMDELQQLYLILAKAYMLAVVASQIESALGMELE